MALLKRLQWSPTHDYKRHLASFLIHVLAHEFPASSFIQEFENIQRGLWIKVYTSCILPNLESRHIVEHADAVVGVVQALTESPEMLALDSNIRNNSLLVALELYRGLMRKNLAIDPAVTTKVSIRDAGGIVFWSDEEGSSEVSQIWITLLHNGKKRLLAPAYFISIVDSWSISPHSMTLFDQEEGARARRLWWGNSADDHTPLFIVVHKSSFFDMALPLRRITADRKLEETIREGTSLDTLHNDVPQERAPYDVRILDAKIKDLDEIIGSL
ncbi:hypothetical protein OF83DRAFT_1088783 [Amylostereum chailletii]|nr:hypothetical protein OF83DRAFT_1088783 [Amylostereum chailletii]